MCRFFTADHAKRCLLRKEEIENAEEEGIEFKFLVAPKRFIDDGAG